MFTRTLTITAVVVVVGKQSGVVEWRATHVAGSGSVRGLVDVERRAFLVIEPVHFNGRVKSGSRCRAQSCYDGSESWEVEAHVGLLF